MTEEELIDSINQYDTEFEPLIKKYGPKLQSFYLEMLEDSEDKVKFLGAIGSLLIQQLDMLKQMVGTKSVANLLNLWVELIKEA